MTIGQRIKTRRLARNLTQAEAAAMLGVGQSRWADLEADRKNLTIGILISVAAVLKCPARDFLDR